jgi:hypothetical protein
MADIKATYQRKLIQPILEEIGKHIKLKAKEMCPVDEGTMMRSIDYKVVGNKVIIFTSGCPYASDIEYGTPPHTLGADEREDIEKWAKRHNIRNPSGTARYIETHGIKVGTVDKPLHITGQKRNSFRPFLRPAVMQSLPEIKNWLRSIR